jgi:hypothetical protein
LKTQKLTKNALTGSAHRPGEKGGKKTKKHQRRFFAEKTVFLRKSCVCALKSIYFVFGFVRFFSFVLGEKVAVGAIDLAKVPKTCPVVDKKGLKLIPQKIASGGRFSGPKRLYCRQDLVA